MIKFFTIAALLISTASAFGKLFTPNVVNVESVGKIENAPYVVSVLINNDLNCGGVIISENFVLTAAACTVNPNKFLYKIHAGSLLTNHFGSEHSVKNIIMHPHFDIIDKIMPVNDIALIKVNEPFVFDGLRDVIPLSNRETPRPQTSGTIFGWGKVNDAFPKQLKSGPVTIIDQGICNRNYFKGRLPSTQICAVSKTKAPCFKDAGGPLVVGVHLVGIISWALDCKLSQVPALYTDILAYRDWINYYVNSNNNKRFF